MRAKLEGFYLARTVRDSLEDSTTMRSGFIDCAGARRENRRPLEYQRGQPAGSVWDRTSAPAAPKPAGATIHLFFKLTTSENNHQYLEASECRLIRSRAQGLVCTESKLPRPARIICSGCPLAALYNLWTTANVINVSVWRFESGHLLFRYQNSTKTVFTIL